MAVSLMVGVSQVEDFLHPRRAAWANRYAFRGERGAVLAFVHVGPFHQTRKARQPR